VIDLKINDEWVLVIISVIEQPFTSMSYKPGKARSRVSGKTREGKT